MGYAQNSMIDSLKKELTQASQDSVKMKIYGHLAGIYASTNQLQLAIEHIDKVIEIAEKLSKIPSIAKATYFKANLNFLLGNYPISLEYYNQALSYSEQIKKDPSLTNAILHGIGKLYETDGQLEKAMEYYQKSLKINESLKDSLAMSLDYNNIGNIHNLSGRYDEAIDYQFKALKIREKANNKGGILYSYNDIGVVYSNKNEVSKSLDYFLKAYQIAEELKEEFFLAVGASNISAAYLAVNQPKEALSYGLKSLEKSKVMQSKNAISQANLAISGAYRALGDYQKALAYQDTFLIYRDSVYNEDKIKEINKIETNFKIEQQKKANEILERKIREQKLWVAGIAIVALLMTALAIFLVRISRLRKKANTILIEKNEEIGQQNEEIRQIADSLQEANLQIIAQKHIIEKKNEDLLSNINYAKRIQEAMLPLKDLVNRHLAENFILFKPKDIVSGDFYYFAEVPSHLGVNRIVIAAVDCTGHGVSGALMSMISSQLLNEIVFVREIHEANVILTELDNGIRKALKQKETKTNDGMDLALCVIDKDKKEVTYAGAKNPLMYIQDNQLFEIKGYRIGIGGEQKNVARAFEQHVISFDKCPTTFYLFSDGFQDQFGGEEGRKFSRMRMRELLLKISSQPMQDQKSELEYAFEQWKGNSKQIDDVMMIGFRLE
jgi:serine phosphatase RsbU (regulator of sigma subunit)